MFPEFLLGRLLVADICRSQGCLWYVLEDIYRGARIFFRVGSGQVVCFFSGRK